MHGAIDSCFRPFFSGPDVLLKLWAKSFLPQLKQKLMEVGSSASAAHSMNQRVTNNLWETFDAHASQRVAASVQFGKVLGHQVWPGVRLPDVATLVLRLVHVHPGPLFLCVLRPVLELDFPP